MESSLMRCPYCKQIMSANNDALREGSQSNLACINKSCGKSFGYYAEILHYYDVKTNQADCLNGTAEHTGKVGGFCELCGEHIDPPEKDKDYDLQ